MHGHEVIMFMARPIEFFMHLFDRRPVQTLVDINNMSGLSNLLARAAAHRGGGGAGESRHSTPQRSTGLSVSSWIYLERQKGRGVLHRMSMR